MRDSKFGLRAFGLALMAALGLMAFMAVAAQAETLTDGGKAANFLVNKETALAKKTVTFEANQEGKGALSVPGRNLGLLCEVGTITGEFQSSTEATGKATFSKCEAWEYAKIEELNAEKKFITHTKKLPCTVTEPIEVKSAKALPKKHEASPYLQLAPTTELFTTVILTGAECPLPKENKITGTLGAQVEGNDTATPKVIASEVIQKLLGDKLLFGAFEAQLKGTSNVKLTDAAHLNKTLGVC